MLISFSSPEAEYTFQLKKPILPMMMQRHYKADGWLGMLLGAKFYINMDGKYDFEEAFQMLLRELAGRFMYNGMWVVSSKPILICYYTCHVTLACTVVPLF